MNDLYLVLCLACFVTLLRDHFGSLRRAIFKGVVQMVLVHRTFNMAVGLVLTVLVATLAMLVNGPATPVVAKSQKKNQHELAESKDDKSLPV